MNERSERLLSLLVERYIEEGQPISSKRMANQSTLALSSATIRNMMAELEAHGYLMSPHTSAGRVPTEKGFRFFVNHLVSTLAPQASLEAQALKQFLSPHLTTNELIQNASELMSNLTQLASIVSQPKKPYANLQHIEFLPLNKARVLTVLVLSNREVHNRIIETERSFSAGELQAAGNFLNHHFRGKSLEKIRTLLKQELRQQKNILDQKLQAAINLAEQSFAYDVPKKEYFVSGKANLLDVSDPIQLGDLKSLLDAFAEKKAITHLFTQCLAADSIQIFIGRESGLKVFEKWSVITAPYYSQDKVVGVLGVVGPQRMAYDKIIPIVSGTAALLSSSMNE